MFHLVSSLFSNDCCKDVHFCCTVCQQILHSHNTDTHSGHENRSRFTENVEMTLLSQLAVVIKRLSVLFMRMVCVLVCTGFRLHSSTCRHYRHSTRTWQTVHITWRAPWKTGLWWKCMATHRRKSNKPLSKVPSYCNWAVIKINNEDSYIFKWDTSKVLCVGLRDFFPRLQNAIM